MLFAVRFTDKPDTQAIRQQFMQAHLDWLDQKQNAVLVGGPLRADLDGPAVGSMWVVEAEDRGEVLTLIETDPFWIEGLRASVEILHWIKARPQRQALV